MRFAGSDGAVSNVISNVSKSSEEYESYEDEVVDIGSENGRGENSADDGGDCDRTGTRSARSDASGGPSNVQST